MKKNKWIYEEGCAAINLDLIAAFFMYDQSAKDIDNTQGSDVFMIIFEGPREDYRFYWTFLDAKKREKAFKKIIKVAL